MTINTSDLDFYDIKSKLKTYFRNSGEFEDYDFDASGLSNILDVLAYNTHINGLIANMSINESFLSTAQLRSSVVSHAESLGYFPKSITAARGVVDVTITIPSSAPSSFTLPKGSSFFASIDETNYEFFTTVNYSAVNDGTDTFTFTGVTVVEGKMKTKTFLADSNIDIPYVIPDSTVDTSTLLVNVFPNGTTNQSNIYLNIKTVPSVSNDSRVYMVNESQNGDYELIFGDGNILGLRPETGNVIKAEYISTSGTAANGATTFVLNEFASEGYTISVSTTSNSAGGSDIESISSIKLNAPLAYSAQNRLVTADDYSGLILSNYSAYVNDVTTWGGNENVPQQYGKVFVSLNFLSGVDAGTKEVVKGLIESQLTSNLSIMSIDTVFVEPQFTYLELQTFFNIDPVKNTTTPESLQSQVDALIQSHMSSTLNSFNSVFRRSNLLSKIDSYSSAILNSRMEVKVQQLIDIDTLIANLQAAQSAAGLAVTDFIEQDHTLNFPVIMASPDKDEHVVTSSVFRSNGQNVVIKNELGSTRLQLLDLDGLVKINNVGSYDPAKGEVFLSALRVDEVGYLGEGIKISATPANQSTINPLRNYIFTLDVESSNTKGVIDSGVTKVLL
tara:strand:+ start:502 stop:2352 length:1851 start_codon:yes stop_codon:yes gene_type:complete